MSDVPRRPARRGSVAVILRNQALLVIRRAEGISAPGKYCFPGGGIERNETEEQALVRELREELSIAVTPVRRLWRSKTQWGIDLAWWLADLAEDAQPIANPAEVQSIHWFTVEQLELLDGLLDSNREFLQVLRADRSLAI
ncbi:MAG TPA: NUDIX domain-containing protein [Pirellulales bacterium]|jgi:8-oxo-dGTP diphosphatase